MARAVSLLSLLVLVSCLASIIFAEPLVRIHARGFVAGTVRRTRSGRSVSAYLGIPYAEPPVGELRFRNPVAKKPWEGVLRAMEDSPQCPQVTPTNVSWSEDCLYLNVYTPRRYKNVEELLPVMFYIHGGAYINGNASSSTLGPEYLLDEDVILVTTTYRLGMLGYLSSGDDAAPGNFGPKDQTLALRWVHEHILAFGGNPKRVTIVGESAGAASVNFLALSEKSKGLFQNYVIQSGSALCPWAFREREQYVKQTERIADYFGCPTKSSSAMVECLRSVSVEDILNIEPLTIGLPVFTFVMWAPTNEHVHEEAFLTDTPLNLIAGNKMKDGALMTGLVQDEGLFVTSVLYANDTMFNILLNDFPVIMPSLFKLYFPNVDPVQVTNDVMKFYFNGNLSDDKEVVLKQLTDFMTDTFFAYPQTVMMKYLRKYNKTPFYFYNFGYRGTFSGTSRVTGNNDNIGVAHADDLTYLFPVNPATFGQPDESMTATDYKVVDTMVDLWTSFVATGVPKSALIEGNKPWPSYRNDDTYLQIGRNSDPSSTLRKPFLQDRMDFWQKRNPM